MERLLRRQGESDKAYHKRLIFGKLVDGSLADIDYSELSTYAYGKEYSSDVARRMFYGSKMTLQLADEAVEQEVMPEWLMSELEEKKIEVQKERQKLSDQRAAFNKAIRERARQEELNEIIMDTIASGNLPSLNYSGYTPQLRTTDSGKDLLVSLNDIHYGACVDNYWNKYNSDICRDMMCTYLTKIIEIGQAHNCSGCIIWANGDAINGSIHHSIAVTNKENVIEQVIGVSELIAEFLAELSKHFTYVQFCSVAGNHSRIDLKERALKDERMDDLIEWYLAARLQHIDNITFEGHEKVDSTMYLVDVRGKTYCGVHGDYDGSSAKIQALQTMAKRPLYAVLSGHKHHNCMDNVDGIRSIMAGSFLGMDDFCVSRRIYGEPQQLVCVCDHTGIVCSYDVSLK